MSYVVFVCCGRHSTQEIRRETRCDVGLTHEYSEYGSQQKKNYRASCPPLLLGDSLGREGGIIYLRSVR